jgi:BolA family transcriptional regulator, general stress-responsive regulator
MNPKEPVHSVARIERALREQLTPERLEISDDSAAHAGHADSGGRGHFRVRIVSTRFAGLSAVQRHRLVNAALAPLWETDLHAVSITALSPDESAARGQVR